MGAMMNTPAMLPLVAPEPSATWFSNHGCVTEREGRRVVFVGGTLIGSFGPRERGARNVMLVGLAADPKIRLGRLARAFGISVEALRQVRRAHQEEGLPAIVSRAPGGSESKVTTAMRTRLEKLFEEGVSVDKAHARLRGRVGRSTVGKVRTAWARARHATTSMAEIAKPVEAVSECLFAIPQNDTAGASSPVPTAAEATQPEIVQLTQPDLTQPDPTQVGVVIQPEFAQPEPMRASESSTSTERDSTDVATGCGSEEEMVGRRSEIGATAMSGGRWVQHVGAWLLLAMLARLGLHRHAEAARERNVRSDALRVAVDAVAIALAIGQRCVEGVRRLATPSAAVLMRATQAPSATWVRRTLGLFAQHLGGARIHLAMAKEIVATEQGEKRRIVFFIDNHLRPYTGQHTIRKGWRMQDKRVLPGTSDYYVHDEDGRPVLRIAVPSHDSLTDWLPPIARLLREALGEGETILLAFDRGGSFPAHMAELRESGFEFVTYERKPYRTLSRSEFKETLSHEGDAIGIVDARTNLGKGRGRVRRIALRLPDDKQVNLLAVSTLPAADLYGIMRGRWRQENGFKHGVERWGINQLDGRTIEPYPSDTLVPNPARRRLDRALRIARVREGDARRKLALLAEGDVRRAQSEEDIDEALALQRDLESLRPSTPTHAPLAETELADKLVKHPDEYKMVIDTIRIACANAEADLARMLAPHMSLPAEAKRALANLFAAPGAVHVDGTKITVALQPAGTKSELRAFDQLLRECNGLRLTLPGDDRRRLRFRLQVS
jgi:transposase-like protein